MKYHRKVIVIVIFFFPFNSFLSACISKNRLTTKTENLPIILVNIEEHQKEYFLNFTCLNDTECIMPLKIDQNYGVPTNILVDERDNFYITFWGSSEALFYDYKNQILKKINPGVKNFLPFFSQYKSKRLILGSLQEIIIFEDDTSQLLDFQTEDINNRFSVAGLFDGLGNKILVLNGEPIQKSDQDYVEVFVIDLDTKRVENKLFPRPSYSVLGNSQNAKIDFYTTYSFTPVYISANLEEYYAVYTKLTNKEAKYYSTYLGKFNSRDGKEISTFTDSGCIPTDGYRQHNNILYRGSGLGEGGGSALILRLEDLTAFNLRSPYIDREAIKLISPYGENFLLGTGDVIVETSVRGEVINEFSLPASLDGYIYKILDRSPEIEF